MTRWSQSLTGQDRGRRETAGTSMAAHTRRWWMAMGVLVMLAGVSAAGATAAAAPTGAAPSTMPGLITIFHSRGFHFSTQGYSHEAITAGPDGALWFTNPVNNTIGRITTTGKVHDYASRTIHDPFAITAGPDGEVWFANFTSSSIGRITTAGKVRAFTGAVWGPVSIVSSPYRTLWYSNWSLSPTGACSSSIGKMNTDHTSVCFTSPQVVYPQNLAAGPDGAIWFTIGGGGIVSSAIGRISGSGKITVYPVADFPAYIAAGSDGALWFTYPDNNAIGRITTNGVLTRFTGPGISQPWGITAGPDGALWFLNQGNQTIGRITTRGHVTDYHGPLGIAPGSDITAGPDGAIWFTNSATNTIGRITTTVTPWIFSKQPASGPPGTQVTIIGRNLEHATQVSFHGTPATIISDAPTYLVTIVPAGATSGRIAITTPAGTATANGWFKVTRAVPHLR